MFAASVLTTKFASMDVFVYQVAKNVGGAINGI